MWGRGYICLFGLLVSLLNINIIIGGGGVPIIFLLFNMLVIF